MIDNTMHGVIWQISIEKVDIYMIVRNEVQISNNIDTKS